MATSKNRYAKIIEKIFFNNYRENAKRVSFKREEIEEIAKNLGIKLPKNIGDIIYSFRYRVPLPDSIRKCAPEGLEWIIRPAGQALYTFSLTALSEIKLLPAEAGRFRAAYSLDRMESGSRSRLQRHKTSPFGAY